MPDPLQSLASVRGVRSYLGRVDPRLRVIAAVVFSVVVAVADRFEVLATALAASVLGLAFSGMSLRAVRRRLAPLNVVLLIMAVLLPLTTQGTSAIEIGPLAFSGKGLALGAQIAVKGNAIVLALLALLGSIDATSLGHALSHLRVPDKLTHLLLFTVRYIDVLHREYGRARAAMKVRGFRPRMDRHTYRSYGYLVGMLLVRSFDRAERIVAAMKCRGFRGRFYILDHFACSRRDVPFCVTSLAILSVLVLLQWTCLTP